MAMKASCGTFTLPMDFMRFLPSACFFSSFFFLRMPRSASMANSLEHDGRHLAQLAAACKLQVARKPAPADISAIALGKNILADGCITGKPVISICHVKKAQSSHTT